VDVAAWQAAGLSFGGSAAEARPLSVLGDDVSKASIPSGERPRRQSRTQYVDVLNIQTSLLSVPAPPEPANPYVDSPIAISEMQPLLSLEIDGSEFLLTIVESRADMLESDIRHVTALIPNPVGYARFSINDGSGEIAATVSVPAATYRILSSGSASLQMVLRLPSKREGVDRFYNVTRFMSTTPAMVRLARQHLLAEALAETQPWGYTRNGGVVYIRGDPSWRDRLGRLERIDVDDPEAIARYLNDIAPMTRATGNEEYEILRVIPTGQAPGVEVWFRQVLNGIPLAQTNKLRLGPTAELDYLQVTILSPPEFVPAPVVLTEANALDAALRLLQQQYPDAEIRRSSDTGELRYYMAADSRLLPVWEWGFDVIQGDRMRHLYGRVDMNSGETRVVDYTIYD
jgi:hypothetical protein